MIVVFACCFNKAGYQPPEPAHRSDVANGIMGGGFRAASGDELLDI
jgi:hypothetical protein